MRLGQRIRLVFLLLVVISTGLVGYLAYENGRRTIIRGTREHLLAVNSYKIGDLRRWKDACRDSLEELAQRPLVRRYAQSLMKQEALGKGFKAAKEKLVQEHLRPMLKYGNFLELFLICPKHGIVLASTDQRQEGKHETNRPYYLEGKNRTYLQNIYYSPGLEQAVMTLSTPVRDRRGNLLGVLAGRLDLGELSRIMEQRPVQTHSEDTYLVNNFHFFITEPRFGRGYALRKSIRTQGVEAALAGKSGTGFYEDYRGEPVIGAFHFLPEFDMAILTEIDQKEAFEPVHHLARIIVGLGLVISLGAVLLAFFFTATITGPVRRLSKGAQIIGAGNLDYRVGTAAGDEIGELSRVMDRMAENLKNITVARDALFKETEQRKLLEESLRAALTRQEALLSAMPDIIMEVDVNKIYTWANPSGLDFFGDDVIGKPADFYFEGEQDTYQKVQPLFAGEENTIYLESWQRRRDGQKRLLAWWCRVLKDPAGKVAGALSSARDITELRQFEELIRKERDFSQAALDSLPGLFYLFDQQGRFLRWNKNLEKISDYASEEISRMSPLDFFCGPDQARVAEEIRRVFQTGEAVVEADFIAKDRTKTPFFFTGSLLLLDQKPCLVGMGIDISERKRAEEALRRKDRELEKRNEELARFLYAVSHDLKSPLVTIQTFLGYVEKDVESRDAQRMGQDLAYIRNAAEKMSRLLEELLNLSRIGRTTNPPVRENLQTIVQEALDLVAGQISERKVEVRITEEPIQLYGDRPRLVEVFQNLIDNAVKFMGDQPNPRVEIGAQEAGGDLVLFVRDNGIGIDQRYQPKLFGLFEKLDPRSEGAGIGLSLVQRIIEVHGGRIWVESEGLGRGATFYFTLAGTVRECVGL